MLGQGTVPCMNQYLHQLTLRLAAGVLQLPEATRQVHRHTSVRGSKRTVGFPAARVAAILYYTGFALRSLFLLGELSGPTADRAADFLRSRFQQGQNTLDLLSLIYGATLLDYSAGIDVLAEQAPAWREAVAESLEQLRRDDGGYARAARAARAAPTRVSWSRSACSWSIGRCRSRAADRVPPVPTLRARRVS